MERILNIINGNLSFVILGLITVIGLLMILIIAILVSNRNLKKKYKIMMRGSNNISLEKLILENLNKIDEANERSKNAVEESKKVENEFKKSISKISVKRYKAFEDVGSDLSYSISMLDAKNNGVILTGIYSRHGSATYAKPIIDGKSTYNLSEEENNVLKESIDKK